MGSADAREQSREQSTVVIATLCPVLAVPTLIKETAKVLAVDAPGGELLLEGIQRSACGTCSARMGCGHRLLARLKTPTIRAVIAADDAFDYAPGQYVEVGIQEDLIVRASLMLYLVPLVGLLFGAGLADYWQGSEWLTMGAGVIGFFAGAWLVGRISARASRRHSSQAQVLRWLANDPA